MNVHQFDFEETKRFSSIFLDYINNSKELQDYYSYRPEIESFEKAIANRNFDDSKRPTLVNSIKEQYSNLITHEAVSSNIEILNQKNNDLSLSGRVTFCY